MPEEILSLTEKKPERLAAQPNPLDTDLCRKSPYRRRHRTVRDTQQMLSVLNRPNDREEFEDEAASTAAFFQNSPSRTARKLLNEVILRFFNSLIEIIHLLLIL